MEFIVDELIVDGITYCNTPIQIEYEEPPPIETTVCGFLKYGPKASVCRTFVKGIGKTHTKITINLSKGLK